MQRVNVRTNPKTNRAEENAVAAAARAGDEPAFAGLAERYRHELQLHCYRMLGSLDDSEDLVQETFLRAWRRRETYQAPSTFRTWLYRIATNACLDFLDHWPHERQASSDPAPGPAARRRITWLQPYPDRLLDAGGGPAGRRHRRQGDDRAGVPDRDPAPPPRQRAVLIMRDVLGWPAKETAAVLETSVTAVNSALQRARRKLRRHLHGRGHACGSPYDGGEQEREALERYMAAIERADDDALIRLLDEDARAGQQAGAGGHAGPEPALVQGRDAIVAAWVPALHGPAALEFRFLPARANRQPAAAAYIRARGSEQEFVPFALSVLRIEHGTVLDVSTFPPDLFPAFDLPAAV